MSPETRRQALEKVGTFSVKIGYPDKWRDYSAFRVDPEDLLGNQARGARFEWNRRLVRLDQPVDRSEWGMSPQTVNAYYNSSLNEIVFPAAILQPPFFDPNADPAVNYGGIGAVIGHEISHGFDDQGSKYDAEGVLRNWWTEADRKNFDERTNALVDQFNTYSSVPGLFVNGRLTLGENIADLAGLTVAQAAYHLSLNGAAPSVLDGFSGDQRLFLGYAQVWRFKAREETLRQRVLSDPHSPPEFRINGIVRNVDAWYEAYEVAPGEKLYLSPASRVHLW
jgi:putative endopeptidase